MAALLQYFQLLLGRKGLIFALAIAAIGAFAYEYSNVFSAYFNAYTQSQLAAVATEKTKGEADKAAQDARSAKAAADNAERLRVAEAEERTQLAKKAAFDAQKAAADSEAARAAADNAGKLRLAEANERAELAKKAAADAEAARAAADNAAKLRLAEAEEKAQLAKKAAADAETARATADNSARMQASLAAKTQEEAETQRLQNKLIRENTDHKLTRADLFDYMGLGPSSAPAPQQQEDEAPANTLQVPPKCRQAFANWRVVAHGAFASMDDGYCAWNGSGTAIYTINQAKWQLIAYCRAKRFNCTIIATK